MKAWICMDSMQSESVYAGWSLNSQALPAQWLRFVNRRLQVQSPAIPKTLKMVLAALLLAAQHYESRARTGQLSVSIMWLGGISCQSVWDVIVQWGSTLKVSIELPATSRHRRDMTERLLKGTLSPNQTNNSRAFLVSSGSTAKTDYD